MKSPGARLCIVVVLYLRSVEESATCRALLRQTHSSRADQFVVYDNSPESAPGGVPDGWCAHADPGNGGLAKAYNYAAAHARAKGCGWLLLLDQDTNLPDDFLDDLHERLSRVHGDPDVVAVVPVISSGAMQISPTVPKMGREVPFERRNVVVADWITAINSGTCVRVDFIETIGGFCEDFWLDYLDNWLFKAIATAGKRVYVGDAALEHDLSVVNMNGVSLMRYRNVLAAEHLFTDRYLPFHWRLIRVPRLLARSAKHLIQTRNKRLGLAMASAAFAQFASLFKRRR